MMKRFLLLLTLLLAGCAACPSAAPPEVTDPATTEPVGWYAPGSQLEAETHGALACYPIQEQGTFHILPLGGTSDQKYADKQETKSSRSPLHRH